VCTYENLNVDDDLVIDGGEIKLTNGNLICQFHAGSVQDVEFGADCEYVFTPK